ncbi:MAG: DUF1194 domain-containing protein [Alphaproteobacteria bacterium]|jgi:hypothetical protein|nr:DUF1194 domain-containing protein [Alphaproteobacteria bacterium]
MRARSQARPRLRLDLIAACIYLLLPSSGSAEERKVDLELVLAADISGSMDLQEAALQRQGFVEALRHPDVIAAIRRGRLGRIAVTYMEWAGEHHQATLVDWAEIGDKASAAAFADAVSKPPVMTELWTSISSIIAVAAGRFQDNDFRGARRIIDISGDGPNNKGAYVVDARDRALMDGITINGLPIVNDRLGPYGFPPLPNLDLYYEDCVIGGEGAFVVVANGFVDFARAIRRKMVLEIAHRPPLPRFLWRVAERPRPPCNAGELQLQKWRPMMYDF